MVGGRRKKEDLLHHGDVVGGHPVGHVLLAQVLHHLLRDDSGAVSSLLLYCRSF